MQIDHIIFYRSFYEAAGDLPKSKQGEALMGLLSYIFDGVNPKFDKGTALHMFWTLVKPNIDAAIENKKNGGKGGRPKKQKGGFSKTIKGGFENSETYKDKDKDKDIDIEEDKEKEGLKKKSIRFTPPTPDEVKTYADEKNLDLDPDRFVDFYASKGWKVGNTPMKDWQSAARNWSRNEKKGGEADVSPELKQAAEYL